MNKILYLGIIWLLSGCLSLPDLSQRTTSQYIPTQHAPRLEKTLQLPPNNTLNLDDLDLEHTPTQTKLHHTHHTNAYVHILDNAQDAFVARSTLIDNADISLDIQYYIWKNDITGSLLLHKLWQAAERGVRIRLLLDDNNTRGMDDILSYLNQHDNIEIRLFNPFLHRHWRALGYLTDFPRMNRRMHNKSLTADNRTSIVGGRNVSDEYFSTHADTAFSDMDVLISGDLVTEISADFDRYWESQSAYPVHLIIKKYNIERGKKMLQQYLFSHQSQFYLEQVAHSHLSQAIAQKNVHHIPAQTELVSDDPAKGLDRSKTKINIGEHILQALREPQQEIYLVSPYFVPTKKGTNGLTSLLNKGIDITVFTNSLAATDVAAVHSGYMRYRKPLLKAGVKLYEFKSSQALPSQKDKGLTGSSSTSLHAKTFIVDKKRVFVGSFNFDPRSIRLNTEMGVVIHHPKLATQMQAKLQNETQKTAYQVELNQKNQIQWQDPESDEIIHHEPQTSWWKRAISKILSFLPIERLL